MSTDEPLNSSVKSIEVLATNVHESCRNASVEFNRATWDIAHLRVLLQEVTDERSRPDSELHDVSESSQNWGIFSAIESCRPLLQRLEGLATKDQGLKKKRIWKRDKDNTAVLDEVCGQLEARSQCMSLHLSALRSSQLSIIENKLKIFVEDIKRGTRNVAGASNDVDHESEADAGWSVIRRELAADGITDVDFEAHKSSIKTLLQERLPSYYESHFQPGTQAINSSVETSGSRPNGTPLGNSISEHTPALQRASRDRSDLGQIAKTDEKSRASHTHVDNAASAPHNSQAMFYIGESTDSESESSSHVTKRLPSASSTQGLRTKSTTKLPTSQQSCTQHQCSLCRQVFDERAALVAHEHEPYIWSCAMIVGHEAAFFVGNGSVDVCGFCGEEFDNSRGVDWVRRRKHLSDIHRWDKCDRDTQFFRADKFRLHLRGNHRTVHGWWVVLLERKARRDCHEDHITDTPRLPRSGRDGRSVAHPPFPASHHEERDEFHKDSVRRPSSKLSRTNSMHRIHSDVSEYDAQGNLTRRTITDSYTSLPDASTTPLERYHSGPRLQPSPSPPPVRKMTHEKARVRLSSVSDSGSGKRNVHCSYCPEQRNFRKRADLTSHLSSTHSDTVEAFLESLRCKKLKAAYERRGAQLHRALQLLKRNEQEQRNKDGRVSAVSEWIEDTLKGLETDPLLSNSSSEHSEDPDSPTTVGSDVEDRWKKSRRNEVSGGQAATSLPILDGRPCYQKMPRAQG